MKTDFEISTNRESLDLEYIATYLSEVSYWAKGRKKERILKAIDNSFCFGVYQEGKQIGFARVVTDFAVFAWILDVFIDPDYQGNGYGKALIEYITKHDELNSVSRWGLNTLDAHELYNQYGFQKIDKPEMYMEMLIKQE